jgi:hypothetical protein
MSIAEAIQVIKDEYGNDLLEGLEQCDNELANDPEVVGPQVARAFRIVMNAGRRMFG